VAKLNEHKDWPKGSGPEFASMKSSKLKLAEQNLAHKKAELATTANKDQVRRQIAAMQARIKQIKAEEKAPPLSREAFQVDNADAKTVEQQGAEFASMKSKPKLLHPHKGDTVTYKGGQYEVLGFVTDDSIRIRSKDGGSAKTVRHSSLQAGQKPTPSATAKATENLQKKMQANRERNLQAYDRQIKKMDDAEEKRQKDYLREVGREAEKEARAARAEKIRQENKMKAQRKALG